MIRYYLRVQTQSPLSITSHQNIAGLANSTLTYIPGTTLRGAMAWQLLSDDPLRKQQAAFQQMFDEEMLRCGPLYPLQQNGTSQFSLPIPLTARGCKHKPGFVSDSDISHRGDGVVDTLLSVIEEKVMQHSSAAAPPITPPLQGLNACESCPKCNAAYQRFGGYFAWGQCAGQPQISRVMPALRLLTRTAMLNELENARPGALFSREAVESGQEFAGFLDVDHTVQTEIEQWFGSGQRLQIGAGRTAGLGQVEILELDAHWNPLAQQLGALQTRWDSFQAKLPPSLAQQWAIAPITFLTDAILLDPCLRYANAPTPQVIRSYCTLAQRAAHAPTPALPPDLTLFAAVSSNKRVAGWNSGSPTARPRFDDEAVAAGSVFVLAAPLSQSAALFALCSWLETHGLGERQSEGFGQLAVALPFHSQGGIL